MRLLITGASGLLGLNLALEAAKEHTVFGVVNGHPLRTEAFSVLQGDLLAPGTLENLLEQAQPDGIIHCAALALLDPCESNPELARQLNTEVPRRLAQLVARGGARLIHISTDSVFDGQRGNYTEEDQPNPLSVYARTKLAGEQAVLEADPSAAVARVNLFGWSLNGTRSLAEWFFNNLRAGKPMLGFTDVFFCPLLANHLAGILVEMLVRELSGLYHVVSGECINKYDFGVRLAEQFGLDASLITPASVTESGLKAARSPYLSLRNDKITAALGHSLPGQSTGLADLYTLYQQGYPQVLRQMAGSHGPSANP